MDAFNRTDEEFGKADNAALVGTTAVVALVHTGVHAADARMLGRQGSEDGLLAWRAGDSRAVLCRGGVAIPLTDDHKAAREDETVRTYLTTSLSPSAMPAFLNRALLFSCRLSCQQDSLVQPATLQACSPRVWLRVLQARVEAAGGQILFWNGVRVMGVLAVSRAIGDHCLRPFVIAQPEVRPACASRLRPTAGGPFAVVLLVSCASFKLVCRRVV